LFNKQKSDLVFDENSLNRQSFGAMPTTEARKAKVVNYGERVGG